MTNTTTLSAEAHRAVTALATARKMVAEAKRIEDAAKAVINAELTEANATHGTDENGTVVVERVTGTNGSFNRADLKTLFPEAFAATFRETTYTKLVVK
jgi:hypothetical protein